MTSFSGCSRLHLSKVFDAKFLPKLADCFNKLLKKWAEALEGSSINLRKHMVLSRIRKNCYHLRLKFNLRYLQIAVEVQKTVLDYYEQVTAYNRN